MKFATKYEHRKKSVINFIPEEGRTKSAFKDECDINFIMKRYNRTGELPLMAKSDPRYGDFSDVPSYMESLERVRLAEEAFYALPAEVRRECDNSAAVFLEKVRNKDWAEKHKLALPAKAGGSPGPSPSSVDLEASRGIQEPPKGGAATRPGADPQGSRRVKKSDNLEE